MRRRDRLRGRFWVEAALGAAFLLLFALTLVTREWIEALTGWDPDHGDGSAEWLVVAVTAALGIAFAALARLEWRRTQALGGLGGA